MEKIITYFPTYVFQKRTLVLFKLKDYKPMASLKSLSNDGEIKKENGSSILVRVAKKYSV